MNEIREGSIVFGCWTVTELIGRGSYGAVYKIKKNQEQDLQGLDTQYAAMKVIYIPSDEQEVRYLQVMGLDQKSIHESFKKDAEKKLREINLMYPLRGHGNIVGYDDSQIIPQNSGIGYVILIRMELLTPINTYAVSAGMNVEQTIQLGIDICQALEACEVKGIMHRDIKPDNIFFSELGSFKLGDFGVGRTTDSTTMRTRAGTPRYMAPEVEKKEKYNATIDLYSLGLVLYQYLNGGRLPFMPVGGQRVSAEDWQTAIRKRLSGVPIPPIPGIDPKLSVIVCKACNYNPNYRYQSAGELKKALLNYRLAAKQTYDFDKTLPPDRTKKTPCLKVGDNVTYGTYKQNGDRSNGKEAIEWTVLNVQENKALLISKYGLEQKRYHNECEGITWEKCTLRRWLNNDFRSNAFTADERDGILKTAVRNVGNLKWKIPGGKDTEDYIFCLSVEEANAYFTSDHDRICYPTKSALMWRKYSTKEPKDEDIRACIWWLRSPGYTMYGAAGVMSEGTISSEGDSVDFDDFVRPALWVDISKLESSNRRSNPDWQ